MTEKTHTPWMPVCTIDQLQPNSGVAALIEEQQIALFYLPDHQPEVYAIGNFDPISKANVLSRGIVGELGGELVVASPVYKQHFRLKDGHCLEEESAHAGSWPCRIDGDQVLIQAGN